MTTTRINRQPITTHLAQLDAQTLKDLCPGALRPLQVAAQIVEHALAHTRQSRGMAQTIAALERILQVDSDAFDADQTAKRTPTSVRLLPHDRSFLFTAAHKASGLPGPKVAEILGLAMRHARATGSITETLVAIEFGLKADLCGPARTTTTSPRADAVHDADSPFVGG